MATLTNIGDDPRPHPAWWQGAVVYEIYPRSFADADGDGVGDLRGVVARLDYLASGPGGLGVDAIWLTPFFPSGGVDGGYDVTDYCQVDPLYGSLEDFDHLVVEAHRRALRVIVDWVPNHTSDKHPWFVEARASRDAPRRDWYVWADGRDGEPPNNWLSAFDDVGPAWNLDDATGQWYLHSYSPHQPELNWDNPEVRAAMHDVMRFWLRRGVDGFRIDVADGLGKDPALGDNPWPIVKPTRESAGLRHDEDWDSIFDRLAELRQVADEFGDRLLVGEVYVLDQARLAEYAAPGRLHLAHDFSLMREPWSAAGFRRVVETHDAVARAGAYAAWMLNNHDHSRATSRFGADGTGQARARLAAVMLLTLRCTPFLFQGEELGLADSPIPAAAVVDVDGRDGVRTPMPWQSPADAGPGAGFTTGRPWLPIPPEAEHASVAAQEEDPDSMLSLYRRLIALRKRHGALTRGGYRPESAPEDVFAYRRTDSDGDVLVALNFAARERRLPDAFRGELLLSSDPRRTEAAAGSQLRLAPHEGLVLAAR
jgi:alpha-glucosidase